MRSRRSLPRWQSYAALGALTLVLACAGGGGGSSQTTTTDATQTPEQTQEPASSPPDQGGQSPAQPSQPTDQPGTEPTTPLPPVGLYYGQDVRVTPSVLASMQAIAARAPSRNGAVFMKVGDSMTVNSSAFCCFAAGAGKQIDLGAHPGLSTTVTYFDAVSLSGGQTSWNRATASAAVGVRSSWPLQPAGGASTEAPLATEMAATNARFAVIVIGTNDLVGADPTWELGPRILRSYAHNLSQIVDTLSAAGVIPLVTFIPPTYVSTARQQLTPAFNAVVRGVATAAQVPTIDFYTDMVALGPSAVISDGVHPTVYPTSGCVLTPAGLAYGYNVRNLRSLQVLDSVRQAMLSGTAPAAEAPALAGRGSAASPVVIPAQPFAFKVPLAGPGATGALDDYASCGGQALLAGDEWVFSLSLTSTTALRIMVLPTTGDCVAGAGPLRLCQGSRDVSVALFGATLSAASCIKADPTMVEVTLTAGRYYVVVDYPANDASTYALLTIDTCLAGDPSCLPR